MANLAQNGVPTDNSSAWGLLQSSPLEGTSKIYLVKDILNNYDNILRYVINNKVNIDGLTAAPAFVNLQTQVNNSAVGTNLLAGTSNQVVQSNNWNMKVADIKYDKSLGKALCASVMINNADHASDLQRGGAYIKLLTLDKSGNTLKSVLGNYIEYNANGLSQCSISIDDNTASVQAYIYTNNMRANAYYSYLKIERGNIPTDWCPNPEDLATSLQQGLDSKVNKTDYTNDLNNVHSSIGQAQTAAVNTSNSYTDKSTNDLKNSLPNFNGNIQDTDDLNNFKTHGIYYRSWSDTIVKNAPTNDDTSKAGELVVLENIQIFIPSTGDSKVYVRNYSGIPGAWQPWKRFADVNDINNLQNQINGTGIGRTRIQWPNGVVTGGNGVYKLIKNNILYINGYGQFNVDTINNYVVANIPEANGRIIITALWVDSVSKDTVALKENGDIEFWGSDLKGKWFYINAAIPLI